MSRLAHGLVLAVGMALPVMAWAQEPAAPSFRSGVGVYWMVSPTRYSFVGGAVRLQLPSPVISSALLEGVLIRNVGADDWIVLADGVLISYVVERTYLGAGAGIARWEDTVGWDKGVWYQTYLKIVIGQEFPIAGRFGYVQINLTLGMWMGVQPVATVGISF
jgi:hypothetical protein